MANIWDPAAGGATVNANNTLQRQRFTAAEGQTDFTLTEFSYVPNTGSTIVFYNGAAQQLPTDYTELSASVIKTNFACSAGDVIDIIGFTGVSAIVDNIRLFNNTVIATAGQTQISTAVAYRAGTSSTALYKNGVRLIPGVDYTETDNAAFLTLTTPATGGETYFSVIGQLVNDVGSDAALISYLSAGTGAVATTVKNRFDRDVYWVTNTGAVGDGSDEFLLIKAAWDYCLANGKDLYFPDGVWSCGINNFPFKKAEVPVTSLLDCGNITIFGNGPTTVLKTDSIDGADVLQLNGLKNIHFRDFEIQAKISGSIAGSNGISVTGGFDNITVRGVTCRDLPSLDKTIFVDGGKALTFQEDGTPNMNTIWGTFVGDIVAIGCAEGLGYEPDLDKIVSSPANVQVNITAVNCYQAVKFAAAEATAALPVGLEAGLRVTGFAVDCQVDVVAGRMHGGSIDVSVVTTKTEAARRLDPNGVAWFAANPNVVSLISTYAKNSKISIKGGKGSCFAKAQIGGTTAGGSGLNGSTEYADIYLDVSGTASNTDIVSIDSGGNTMRLSRLSVTRSTASSIPSDFLLGVNSNSVELIGDYKFGNIRFPASQISSTDPNILDDYEEGSFIPALTDTSLVDEGATYSLQTGRYTKIGDMVHFSITLSMTGLGTLDPLSSAFVIGLPFPSLLSSANIWQCNAGTTSNLNFSAAAVMQARISAGESYIELRKVLATSTTGDSPMLVSDVSADGAFVISGSYKTAT